MRQLMCMVMVLVTVAYITIGGVVFHLLEEENEVSERDRTERFLVDFLGNNTCVSVEELSELLRESFTAYKSGNFQPANQTSAQTNWDYYSSIFFAMTVVTTIGYGNISPTTLAGRIFVALFSILGIPLFLVTATAIGERLFWLIRKCQKRCFERDDDGEISKKAKICGNAFYVVLGCGLMILVPAGFFLLMEEWTYIEGCYYSLITLTTIGFGDYVAGTADPETNDYYGFRGIYRLCVAGWIFIGLSWMAGVISHMQDLYSKRAEENQESSSNPRNSNSDSQGGKDRKRDLERVYSRDSGYSNSNGTHKTHSPTPYDNHTPPRYDGPPRYSNVVETNADPDVFLTKL